jgi:hypothetical protein
MDLYEPEGFVSGKNAKREVPEPGLWIEIIRLR